jgi:hypothetical protein
MSKTVAIPDELYERLAALARPFLDKEPADVIRRLVDREEGEESRPIAGIQPPNSGDLTGRAPRERGAVVDLDGTLIQADSVPDLCAQVMEYMHSHKHWDKVMSLAPYKTSAQRYLFAETDKHPNGKDFFVPAKCHGLYVEAHKNYQTAISQLARFAAKCGVTLKYKGT